MSAKEEKLIILFEQNSARLLFHKYAFGIQKPE